MVAVYRFGSEMARQGTPNQAMSARWPHTIWVVLDVGVN
jgi:hypothetical protein